MLITDNGVVVVDTKLAGWGQVLLAKIKTVTSKPVTTIINTHTHGDHTGSNEAFAGTVDFVAHENTKANMEKMDAFKGDKTKFLPKRTFKDKLSIGSGKDRIDLYYFGRGHTNGDSVIYFPSEKVLHTGDLFTSGAPYCDSKAGCSIKEWDKTLQKAIQAYDFDTVIPGHGPVMKRADLSRYAQNIAVVRDRLKAACAGGEDTAAKRLDFKDLGLSTSPIFETGVPGMCRELAQ